MNISIFGLGYVGVVTAACLASDNHKVIGVDIVKEKVDLINEGKSPIVEERINELISQAVASRRLRATTGVRDAINETDMAVICVGTPSREDGSLETRHLKAVIREIGEALQKRREDFLVVVRSTIVPGTMRSTIIPFLEETSGKKLGSGIEVVFHPEFLREGSSVKDFYEPPKIVVGERIKGTGKSVMELYESIEAPRHFCSFEVAEMVKYVDNMFHAVKITFANEIGLICGKCGIDSRQVMEIFRSDTKLNISPAYLKPGFAFGGSCLPKDLRAVLALARVDNIAIPMLEHVMISNKKQVERVLQLILKNNSRIIGFYGLAFKTGTDDLRESALVELAEDKGLTLMVGHLLQYHPVFQRLKEVAAAGELGRINYIYSNRLNLGKIRREENILWSFAPHDISMILTLAGEEPESVLATGGYYLHQRIADVTTTHLAFSSGLQAQVFVSWLHPFKEQKLVVVGDKKMAVFDDTLPWEDKLLLYAHEIQWQDHMPVPAKAEPERPDIPPDEPLRLECAHFVDAFVNGRKPLTDGREGVRVLKVLNAAQESLDNGGCSVSITPGGALREPAPAPEQPFFVHETAVVDKDCEIGDGTRIWHFTHVLARSRIGEKCNIGQNVMIGPDVTIGRGCKLQNNVSVYTGVTLEDFIFCGPSMVFTNVYNPRAGLSKMDQARSTLVREGATIGANATIVCGNTLGRYCFVGAGAVVNRNVPDYALVVGNPARRIGWVCRCGERLPDDLTCLTCGKTFQTHGEGVREA